LLFGVIAIQLKKVAPSSHTVAEIVNARWGRTAHLTFLFFCFCANIIVTAMLLLGGAATVQALTGMNLYLAAFLIPWGVILYTASGGLQATFLASYLHTAIIFSVVITMVFLVYIKIYSSDQIYEYLENTVSYSLEECQFIFSDPATNVTFFEPGKYACGPVASNHGGSYLTMLSANGLMFGIINIVGNFGTVFVDQSYWQSAIAARPSAAAKGYLLGGICWFAIPFSLATSLGLTSTALMLPITSEEAAQGLVPPAVATELLGSAGAVLVLVMLFMAIVSTGSAESIAVSSLVAYDVYREVCSMLAIFKVRFRVCGADGSLPRSLPPCSTSTRRPPATRFFLCLESSLSPSASSWVPSRSCSSRSASVWAGCTCSWAPSSARPCARCGT
jgi:Na+/proline symporter